MSDLKEQRPNYDDDVVVDDNGDLGKFTDPMNKFLDDLIDTIEATPAGDITLKMGNRITGDASLIFGSRV